MVPRSPHVPILTRKDATTGLIPFSFIGYVLLLFLFFFFFFFFFFFVLTFGFACGGPHLELFMLRNYRVSP